MRRLVLTFLVTGLIAGASRDAAAQTRAWDDRVYLNIGFGVESGTSALADSNTFLIYDETGTVATSSTYTSGSLFDVGIGFRIWRNVSVGASYHQEQNTADITVSGSVPHPVFFNQPRSFLRHGRGSGLPEGKGRPPSVWMDDAVWREVRRPPVRRAVVVPARAARRERHHDCRFDRAVPPGDGDAERRDPQEESDGLQRGR